MKQLFAFLFAIILLSAAQANQSYLITENFTTPRFYNDKFFMYNTDSTTAFVRSNNTGFEWGAYSPLVTTDWGPIGYLYNADVLEHRRNALCFTSVSEYPGSYAYCQFDSPDSPGKNDTLTGLKKVVLEFWDDGPQDLLGLMVRDGDGQWYYSKSENGIYASGSQISFSDVDTFGWMQVAASISDNLNLHTDIASGLGDIRDGAVGASPDLSGITGAGILLHEAAPSDYSLRIRSITWEGTVPETAVKLVLPENNSTLTILNTTLKWEYTLEDTVRYDVWLGMEGEALNLIGDSIEESQLNVDVLSDNSNYQWRVDAINKYGLVETGLIWIFNTKKGMSSYFDDLQTTKLASTPFVKWTNLGPGMSGYVDEYFVHPTDPNSMYMSLDMGNSFYSHDNGLSWVTTKDWDHDGENYRPVWMDYSHQDPDFGYAIDEKGNLLKTTDRGATFTDITSFPASKKHSVITVDPNNENNWYVGAGQFWRVKFIHRSLADIHGTQYRNTEYGHIYVSKNKGLSWTKVSNGFNPNLDVAKIFVDPENSDVVYVYSNYGFYKSTDGGYNWELKGEGLPYNRPRDGDIYYDKSSGEFNLYLLEQTHYEDDGNGSISTTGGVYKSIDRGESWTSITGNLAIDLTKIHSTDVDSKYYRALAYWFGIDATTAASRFNKKPEATYTVFNRIVVSAKDPDVIFLSHNIKHDFAFGPGDIWRSSDGGANWVVCGRNGPYWVNNTDRSYWESRNNPLGMNMNYAHMDHDMREEGVLAGTRMLLGKIDGDLICGHEQQMFRSTDLGDNWMQIDDDETAPGSGYWVGRGGSNLPGEGLELETGMSRYLFMSGEHGLWISAPDGQKIKPEGVAVEQLTGQSKERYDATSIGAAAVHPADTNTFYILMFRQSHRGYLRRTQDGGASWENISYPVQYGGNLSSDHIFQYDFRIDKDDPKNMYFCVPTTKWQAFTSNLWNYNGPADYTKYGVFRSQDEGYNWELANNGLPDGCSVYRLEMDPFDSRTIYACLNKTMNGDNGGLYKTENGGDLWEKVSIPSVIESVNFLHVDRTTRAMYLSAGEYVGEVDKGGVWVSHDLGANWEKIFYMPNVNEAYSSNVDPNLIVVNVGRGKKVGSRNTGVFYSRDSGQNWSKANFQLGQPGRIRALRPDPRDENVFWLGLAGSGWYKGVDTRISVRAMANNQYMWEGDEGMLDASGSFGSGLSYEWETPAGIELSSSTSPTPAFTAPQVSRDTSFKLMLHVSDGTDSDSLQVLIEVRNEIIIPDIPLESIEITDAHVEMDIGASHKFEALFSPANATNKEISWISGDVDILTIDQAGMALAVDSGQTYVVAFNEASSLSDTCTVSISTVVGVFQSGYGDIQLFPNPVEDVLRIRGAEKGAFISLLTLSGITLIQTRDMELDLGGLEPGGYLLKIESGHRIRMSKIIKL